MKILVIGDSIEDVYWIGTARLSPDGEDHLTFASLLERSQMGAAYLVDTNLQVLGHKTWLVHEKPPSRKYRFMVGTRCLLRVDQNVKADQGEAGAIRLATIRDLLKVVDGVVLSDYGKGVLADHAIYDNLSDSGLPVFIDPFPRHEQLYGRLSHDQVKAICPCAREFNAMNHDQFGFWFVKRGAFGADLMTHRRGGLCVKAHVDAKTTHPVSTIGAGDAFISVVADQLLRGETPVMALRRANAVCGRVVERAGNVKISPRDLFWRRSGQAR